MEKGFHPISGETVYLATEEEKQIIDIALVSLLSRSESDLND